MNRLAVRLVVSHALVAVIATVACVVVVHRLAPALFDESLRMGFGRGMPSGFGPGVLRGQVAEAVDRAMLVGTVVGVLAATAFGAVAATALTRPLARLRLATRQLADGRYDVPVTAPATRELADLADDITTLASALADTEARRVRLLGDVAHELRTPLTVVDGYVEGMIDGVIPTSPEELARVGAEVARLRRLADDLSNLSRVAEGRVPLRPQMVDLRDVVVAAAKRLQAQAEDAGLTLEVDGGAAPLPVLADPDRIGQVVGNLVGNAIRATPSGGRVSVRCAPHDDEAEFSVTDTGEGLAADDLHRIFERFYRVDPRRPGGSGIGLTIARGLVEAHHGSLVARSAGPGRGAVFTARLPAAGRDARPGGGGEA